jgi:hypothetical protein
VFRGVEAIFHEETVYHDSGYPMVDLIVDPTDKHPLRIENATFAEIIELIT